VQNCWCSTSRICSLQFFRDLLHLFENMFDRKCIYTNPSSNPNCKSNPKGFLGIYYTCSKTHLTEKIFTLTPALTLRFCSLRFFRDLHLLENSFDRKRIYTNPESNTYPQSARMFSYWRNDIIFEQVCRYHSIAVDYKTHTHLLSTL